MMKDRIPSHYTETCDCGTKATVSDISFSEKPNYRGGSEIIARYTCKKCNRYHVVRTIL